MAKATKSVDTPKRSGNAFQFGVATKTIIYAGTIVALNVSGYIVPASDTAGLKVVGIAKADVDNSNGENGVVNVDVECGVFRFNNSATKPLSQTDWNSKAFIEDDNTVAKASANSVCAGVVVGVDDVGVWVDTKRIPTA